MTREAELALKISELEDKLAIATGEDKMRADVVMNELEYYKNKSAELELEIARLREALQTYIDEHEECQDADDWLVMVCSIEARHVADEALSTPPSTTALQDLIEKVERRTIERCAREVGDGIFGHDECANEIRALPTGNLKLEDLR